MVVWGARRALFGVGPERNQKISEKMGLSSYGGCAERLRGPGPLGLRRGLGKARRGSWSESKKAGTSPNVPTCLVVLLEVLRS